MSTQQMSISTVSKDCENKGKHCVLFQLRNIRKLVNRLLLMIQKKRQRTALSKLDERLLKDIGISRADVNEEIARPFWQ